MAKFNLNEYEMVEDRLKKFWSDNPNGRIETNVVHITDDGSCVTIKAEVFPDAKVVLPVSTGIAQETKGQGGFANADAWMENCETSAIGRALANWKYQGSTKPRPSREEMSKVGNETSEPRPKKSTATMEASTDIKETLSDANYNTDNLTAQHKDGSIAMDTMGIYCPCGSPVKYFTADEKNSPRSPDFRCTAMGKCTAGDTVDGKVFAKSWWMDNKDTPEGWKDYAAAVNGIVIPVARSLDDIGEDEAPF